MIPVSRKEAVRRNFVFYLLSAGVLALQFVPYLFNSRNAAGMDFGGWLYFLASCLTHAALIALIPLLLFGLPGSLAGWRRTGVWLQVGVTLLLVIFNHLNSQVYALYRFHINGFVLNLAFGAGADEIFVFSPMLYLKLAGAVLLFVALCIGGWRLAEWISARCRVRIVGPSLVLLIVATLFAQGYHVYGAFMQKSSVLRSTSVIPFYYPLQANRLMIRCGFEPPVREVRFADHGNAVQYPRRKLEISAPDGGGENRPNILFILIDSWSKRALTPDCMPNVCCFAERCEVFDNHLSSSNGTRNSVFGLFFGLPGYYWDAFEAEHIRPLLISRLIEAGYDLRILSSATLLSPPFHRIVFGDVPDLRVRTPGDSSCERDNAITEEFLASLDRCGNDRPFFSFLFYDLPHAISVPAAKNTRFQPAWDYADYMSLDNETNPEPFFNLYRNCCYEDDRLIGRLLQALQEKGLLDSTIVIITGDHGQEFNENRRNFWGHNGNYSRWQLGVPMIYHFPGRAPAHYAHRTTHYDVVPTLMTALGVVNPAEDYSLGLLLTDTTSRNWHFAGSGMNYAFLIDDDLILEKKTGGALEITDRDLNPMEGFRIDPAAFDAAMKRLNSFYR